MNWEKPETAMSFRDALTGIVESLIDKLRPKPVYGTVLRVRQSGPQFRVNTQVAVTDPAGPPEPGPGNPIQSLYAIVRLDNGEEVEARVHETIPVARDATFYEPSNPSGDDGATVITDDVYRTGVLTTVIVDGVATMQIIPDFTKYMPTPPVVPPRVMLEGKAGSYIVTRIIRGMAELDNPVIKNAYQVGPNKAGYDGNELRTYQSERYYNKQGWIGNTSWNYSSGFEVELSYSGVYQKYILPAGNIELAPRNLWMIVPPVSESFSIPAEGFPSDQTQNVLLIHIQDGNVVNFYVCNRNLTEFSVASDLYLNGAVVFRSINGSLIEVTGLSMPVDPELSAGFRTFGLSDAPPGETSIAPTTYSRPGTMPSLMADLNALKFTLSGGGVVSLALDAAGVKRLKWNQRFICMTARSIYKQNGYFNIELPAPGTQIPVYGTAPGEGADQPPRDCTVDGIDVSGWIGLYYALPFGGDNANSQAGNFVISRYGGFLDIPDNWVLIYFNNGDLGNTGVVTSTYPYMMNDGRLGTGCQLSMWRDVKITTPFTHSGLRFQYKIEGAHIYLKGGILNSGLTTVGTTDTTYLNWFPAGARPAGTRVLSGTWLNAAGGIKSPGRFDIGSTGNFALRDPVAPDEQIFFDGIVLDQGA